MAKIRTIQNASTKTSRKHETKRVFGGRTIGDILLEAQHKKSNVVVAFDKPTESISDTQSCNVKLVVENKSSSKVFFEKAQQEKQKARLRQKELNKFANELKRKSIQFQEMKRKLAKKKSQEARKLLLETCENEARNLTVLFIATKNVVSSVSKVDNPFDVVQLSEVDGLIENQKEKKDVKKVDNCFTEVELLNAGVI